MKQRIQEMWVMRTKQSSWEHLVTVNEDCFINGTQCETYDFWEIHRTAFRVSDLRVSETEVLDKTDLEEKLT